METSKLKPCPFCGGEAFLRETRMYASPSVVVKCSNCHAQTEIFLAGYDVLEERNISAMEAGNKAVKCWNSRHQAC